MLNIFKSSSTKWGRERESFRKKKFNLTKLPVNGVNRLKCHNNKVIFTIPLLIRNKKNLADGKSTNATTAMKKKTVLNSVQTNMDCFACYDAFSNGQTKGKTEKQHKVRPSVVTILFFPIFVFKFKFVQFKYASDVCNIYCRRVFYTFFLPFFDFVPFLFDVVLFFSHSFYSVIFFIIRIIGWKCFSLHCCLHKLYDENRHQYIHRQFGHSRFFRHFILFAANCGVGRD